MTSGTHRSPQRSPATLLPSHNMSALHNRTQSSGQSSCVLSSLTTRRDCARSRAIWIALRDALDASSLQTDMSVENTERLLALLRLVQFFLAGEPTLHVISGSESISLYFPVARLVLTHTGAISEIL